MPRTNKVKKPEINDSLIESFKTFLELVPVKRLSHSVRELMFCYLIQNIDSGFLTDFDDRLKDLLLLFELFDSIDENDEKSYASENE